MSTGPRRHNEWGEIVSGTEIFSLRGFEPEHQKQMIFMTVFSMFVPFDSVKLDYPSVFAHTALSPDMPELDIEAVKLLYNPKLKSGMKRDEAMKIVRDVLKER